MYTLSRNRCEKGKELRSVVVETLQELMKIDDAVIALEADLGGASGFTKIKKTNPDRFIQCGIAEANMVGVGAGLSLLGFKPFMHSFSPFATRRVFDQIFLSGGYARTTLNIYGSDPGFTVGPNGGTHTSWEDVALIRSIPNAIICDPADEVQLQWVLRTFAELEGIHYVRANRKDVRNVYGKDSTFTLGKGNILTQGSDVVVVVAGQLVSEALDCAEELKAEGISVEIIDMFTIKPLDKALILQEMVGKKAILTFENHSVNGGLGSAVAEVLAEHGCAIKLKRMGVNERFGEVGSCEYLQKEFKLTADDLKQEIKALL